MLESEAGNDPFTDRFNQESIESPQDELNAQVDSLEATITTLRQRLLNQRQEVAEDLRQTADGNGIGLTTVAVAAVVVGVLGAIAGRETGMGQ
jgi:F0F1-type ATP synthase assembly protein I